MHIVYVAPFFLPATRRFLGALAGLSGVRLSLISTDPPALLPPAIRSRLVAHHGIPSCLDPGQLAVACNALAAQQGPIVRLLGTLEDLQVPLARVREHLGIPGMDARTADNFRDKSKMKAVLRDAGVPCAGFCLARSTGEATAFAATVGYPLVVKPPAGAGARGTFRVTTDAELASYLGASGPSAARPVLLEEFMTGEEHSFDCVSIRGRPVWHSLTRYYPTPLEVLQNPWIQWCVLLPREVDDPRYDDIRRVGVAALAALNMGTGLSHMEWFRRPDGTPAVSEVGARPPGAQFVSLISLAHDVDMYAAWARLVAHEAFEIPERRAAAGAAYLRGIGQGRVAAVHGLDQAQREVGELVVEARLPRVGQRAGSGYEGDGYVLVRHPRTEVVAAALKRLVELIRVEYVE